ncbi:hypothetical protein Tco_1094111 [Tanacetum coccineum]|uniref:MAK10-like protein n=1 Tax=Tanacetum coccineum TaxID=301880 RepID=A0ABQ5IEN6_9ASTR
MGVGVDGGTSWTGDGDCWGKGRGARRMGHIRGRGVEEWCLRGQSRNSEEDGGGTVLWVQLVIYTSEWLERFCVMLGVNEESWALLEDLALYDNESWNDPRDFAKPVKAIALPQDVPSTSDRRLIELENQVQRLMEAHLAPTQPTQVNKITTSCEICSGPHDTQYCMEDPE